MTTISLSGWSAGADEDDLLQQVVTTFEQSHPSIKVNYSVINGDYTTAMTARFAARNAARRLLRGLERRPELGDSRASSSRSTPTSSRRSTTRSRSSRAC